MAKKSQANSQIFVYVLGVIVILIILFVGYKLMSNILSSGKAANTENFKTEIKEDIEGIGNEYGSEVIQDYDLPRGYEKLCLVDLENVNLNNIDNLRIRDSVESGVEANVFMEGEKAFDMFYVDGLRLEPPYITCISAENGKLELEFKGKGDSAQLQSPVDNNYCTNAQENDLCDGLDIVFGTGYKEDCCNEFSLCC